MIVEFYGMSDEVVNVAVLNDEGKLRWEEEFMMWEGHKIAGRFSLRNIGVYAIYDGCWTFAPTLIDSSDNIPVGWTFTYYRDHQHSLGLRVQTTEDVRVTRA